MPTNFVLVVGGAGYIGSHMVLALNAAGYQPIVLDNLSKGHRHAVIDAELVVGEMADVNLLQTLFSQYKFCAVMHFASLIEVNESLHFPDKYYQNNVSATLTLLDIMLKNDVKHFIFSSSAAVYGDPVTTLISESHPLSPINPYGRSKRIIEDVLAELASATKLKYAALRYFNASGADPEGRAAEQHEPESHLIPIVLQVASGKRKHIEVYGKQYPTLDGTCVRDYVHVTDLCRAHLLALDILLQGEQRIVCNLGTGLGHSVLQVIEAVKKVTGQKIHILFSDARAGDSAVLVADATLASQILNWKPAYPELEAIIKHAWAAYALNSSVTLSAVLS